MTMNSRNDDMAELAPFYVAGTLSAAETALCTIGVWGPKARDLVASVCAADLSNEAFPYGSVPLTR